MREALYIFTLVCLGITIAAFVGVIYYMRIAIRNTRELKRLL